MSPLAFEKPLPDAVAQAENLPSLPSVAMDVLRLCEDENSTLEDLAEAVQQDRALAVKMLKLSNSSLFGLGQQVTTLKHASMVLGMKTVKLMSVSFSLADALPKDGTTGFDYQGYWRRSLVAAVAGRSFARLVGGGYDDEAFLCGLLSHLGQLVLAECLDEVYAAVTTAAEGRWPDLALEDRVLGFNHSDVSGTLLRSWNLPPAITLPVGFMFRAEELPDGEDADVVALTRIMAVATQVVGVLCENDGGVHLKAFQNAAAEGFGIEAEEAEQFLIDIESGIREAAAMFLIDLPDGVNHDEIVERAHTQMVRISISTTADLQFAERRAADLESKNRELTARATTDKLTGLPNRSGFDDRLEEEIRSRIDGEVPRALGVVMMDVDRFKLFNDAHGHQAGDAVLEMIGRVLAGMTRNSDFCARYGGEEFALILPQTTPHHTRLVANRVREAIAAEVVEFGDKELRVTASFGGACTAEVGSPQDGRLLVKLADKFLYKAKENGRNRVEVYTQPHLPAPPREAPPA